MIASYFASSRPELVSVVQSSPWFFEGPAEGGLGAPQGGLGGLLTRFAPYNASEAPSGERTSAHVFTKEALDMPGNAVLWLKVGAERKKIW